MRSFRVSVLPDEKVLETECITMCGRGDKHVKNYIQFSGFSSLIKAYTECHGAQRRDDITAPD
jgi:hypothetical protein